MLFAHFADRLSRLTQQEISQSIADDSTYARKRKLELMGGKDHHGWKWSLP